MQLQEGNRRPATFLSAMTFGFDSAARFTAYSDWKTTHAFPLEVFSFWIFGSVDAQSPPSARNAT
ncbi:MAG: hypothetical protein ACKO3P_11310, partial [Planctomycetaceae bacterium]